MRQVHPAVFMLAETQVNPRATDEMLDELGVSSGYSPKAPSGSEQIIEIAGRLCYRSFEPGLNPNVKKVREGNAKYIKNILKHHHGSVLEHGSVTFGLINVTRVVTHELVRHRAGCAYSQESLRYVRLTEIPYYWPPIFGEVGSQDETDEIKRLWEDVMKACERFQVDVAELLDVPNLPFELKKQVTSAMRRAAPIGLATSIVMTANHRAWRHIIELRTSTHAEEEVRLVVGKIARSLKDCFPHIYQDMSLGDYDEYTFENSKV